MVTLLTGTKVTESYHLVTPTVTHSGSLGTSHVFEPLIRGFISASSHTDQTDTKIHTKMSCRLPPFKRGPICDKAPQR